MAFLSLYSASIYQSASTMVQITASAGGKSLNLITGSFTRTATGSYTFVSSGSFIGASGSITGSVVSNILFNPQVNTSSLGSIFVSTSPINPNAFYVYTFSNFLTQTLSDNAIESGSYQIDIGIEYL
jgi:hypothetical protein